MKLAQRKPAEARRRGVVAKPGMGLILLGSASRPNRPSRSTGRRSRSRLARRAEGHDGPKLDLQARNLQGVGQDFRQAAFSQDIKIVAGQTSGLLIGPGGIFRSRSTEADPTLPDGQRLETAKAV